MVWDSEEPTDQSANGALCSEASDYLSFLSVSPESADQLNCRTNGSLSFRHVPNLKRVLVVVPVTDEFQPYPSTYSVLLGQIDLGLNYSFTIYHK